MLLVLMDCNAHRTSVQESGAGNTEGDMQRAREAPPGLSQGSASEGLRKEITSGVIFIFKQKGQRERGRQHSWTENARMPLSLSML